MKKKNIINSIINIIRSILYIILVIFIFWLINWLANDGKNNRGCYIDEHGSEICWEDPRS